MSGPCAHARLSALIKHRWRLGTNELVSAGDSLDDLRPEARRLGADHALAVGSWTIPNEEEAASVLEDVDTAVWDKWAWPNLSGEWADDPTPATLLRDLGLDPGEVDAEQETLFCESWQETADEVFVAAIEAMALRLLNRVGEALLIERSLERRSRGDRHAWR